MGCVVFVALFHAPVMALEERGPPATSENPVEHPIHDPESRSPLPAFLEGHETSYVLLISQPSHYISYLLSAKYSLSLFRKTARGAAQEKKSFVSRLRSYLTYTTKYDFYIMGARSSEPVLIKLANAGLKLRYEVPRVRPEGFKSVGFGYYHESNGQAIDTNDQYLDGGPYAKDLVSRGWDYLGADLRFLWPRLRVLGITNTSFTLRFESRIFLPYQLGGAEIEDRLFWEADPRRVSIGDYDGLRLSASLRKKSLGLVTDLRMGYTGASPNPTISIHATYRLGGRIPLMFAYFRGYGRDISTYHIWDSYGSFGLELW